LGNWLLLPALLLERQRLPPSRFLPVGGSWKSSCHASPYHGQKSLAIYATVSSSDNLAQIEQVSSSTTNLLAAVQANTDAVLAVAQGLELERQLLATLITVEATKAGEEFNEKAQEEATNARRWNLGVEPGQ